MAKLNLSVAVGDYDRTRPLIDGTVQIDGVDPVFMTLAAGGDFLPRVPHAEFDICELSLSSFTVKTAQGNCPYVGVPAFVSRAFRHTSIYVRTDRIKKPEDLKGSKVGVPEYQLTANVWARAILQDDYGVKPSDIHWVRGGIEDAGRPEKITHQAAARREARERAGRHDDFRRCSRRARSTASSRRARRRCRRTHPNVGWLFPDPVAAAKDYFKRTGIFPIMHLVGVRRTLAEQASLAAGGGVQGVRAGQGSGARRSLSDTSATKVTLPFIEEQLTEARALMGEDFWSYGVAANRKTLETFLRHHHAQGLSSRLVTVEEMFHPGTLETFKL